MNAYDSNIYLNNYMKNYVSFGFEKCVKWIMNKWNHKNGNFNFQYVNNSNTYEVTYDF